MFLAEVFAHVLFGLIIGSFLNVVLLRSFTGKSLQGRSGCLSCGASIPVSGLIPVVSWFALKARCVHCGSRISLQYPLVELGTALAFGVVAGMQLPLTAHIAALVLAAFWMLIVAYDIKHTIVPDPWVVGAVISAAAVTLSLPQSPTMGMLFINMFIVATPLFLLWFFSKGYAMGFGDVKLALVSGALLGVHGGLASILLAFVLGAIISLSVLVPWPYYEYLYTRFFSRRLRRPRPRFTMKSEVPFGPFIVLGACTIWIYDAYHLSSPLFDMLIYLPW